jgi:GNAT superfamily N-acetyltransferase
MLVFGLPMTAAGVWLLQGSWLTGPPRIEIEIRQVRFDDPDALQLIEEVQAEYTERYGGPDEGPVDPSMFDPPDGAFFVGYYEDRPVAMGGWRRRPDVQALDGTSATEIKRMYVHADVRRHGIARQLLAHLELTARYAGSDVMVLETGIEQPEAISLYIREGYTTVMPFGHYKDSPKARYYGKRLEPFTD